MYTMTKSDRKKDARARLLFKRYEQKIIATQNKHVLRVNNK